MNVFWNFRNQKNITFYEKCNFSFLFHSAFSVFCAISNYESKQFSSIWKYYLTLRSCAFTFTYVLVKYFCLVLESFKRPITLVKLWICFYFLSLTSLYRNIIKYRLYAIKCTGNLSVWSANFGNRAKMLSGLRERFFYSFSR